MNEYNMNDSWVPDISLNVRKGMGWVIYTDKGPTGVRGQSMSITCPHSYLALFENEEDMRKFLEGKCHRNGRHQNVQYGVVGEYGTGQFRILTGKPK